jgi:hypothetical protein
MMSSPFSDSAAQPLLPRMTNDISYRPSVAPDGIQGRMNSTIRTMNRIV